ncbi:MAG: hypothetical protein A2Y81_05315 [Nitrospirae bacterium RBG_13_43_8]|nr:MAG: hypothetical protein A2Y81_05315 [Nitrospirae bacterium RBG_13_43_8]
MKIKMLDYTITNTIISMKTLIIKSLLTSLCQREEMLPSLPKRGKGRFFNNDALLIHFLLHIAGNYEQNGKPAANYREYKF